MLACVTPGSRRADSFVRREIEYALLLHKPVTPVRFADVPPPTSVVTNERVDAFENWPAAAKRIFEILDRRTRVAGARTTFDPWRDHLDRLYRRLVQRLEDDVVRLVELHVRAESDTGGAGTESPIAAVRRHSDRMILIGAAGSGKTITLTALARDAVARRLADATAPLPIVGTIATWDARERPPLHAWLAAEAEADPDAILSALSSGSVQLFLDGLDELRRIGISRSAPPTDPRRSLLEELSIDAAVHLVDPVLEPDSSSEGSTASGGARPVRPPEHACRRLRVGRVRNDVVGLARGGEGPARSGRRTSARRRRV